MRLGENLTPPSTTRGKSFPWFTVIGCLLAIPIFGGRAVKALMTGSLKIPFGPTLVGADQPFVFYGATVALFLAVVICLYVAYDEIKSWRTPEGAASDRA